MVKPITLQGGFDPGKLKGMDKMLIGMLTKGLKSQKERSPEEERMLELLLAGGDYVSKDNLGAVLEWLGEYEVFNGTNQNAGRPAHCGFAVNCEEG